MSLPRTFGLQKTSLADYPGKVASVIFFPECNLRCPYCHNAELILGKDEGLIDRDDVILFLKNRAPLLGGVVLSGGEPLFYEGLKGFISQLKKIPVKAVKLDTNGSYPDRLRSLIDSEGCPDFIAMDIKTAPSLYSRIPGPEDLKEKILKSVEILKNSGLPFQFRSTVHPDFIDLTMVEEISELIRGCSSYVLNEFRPGNCLSPDYNSHSTTDTAAIAQLQNAFVRQGIPCLSPSVEYGRHSL